MTNIRLAEKAIKDIRGHAEEEYPRECCGVITGDNVTHYVHKCINRQDELHARDPDAHPRTSREAYAIDRGDVESIFRNALQKGEEVIAFYHSHIDCGAYFSPMDKEVQTVFGEPEFPDALHVVLAVFEGKVRELKGFIWNKDLQDFVTADITRDLSDRR